MLFKQRKMKIGQAVMVFPYLCTFDDDLPSGLRISIKLQDKIIDCFKDNYNGPEIMPGDFVEFKFKKTIEHEPRELEIINLISRNSNHFEFKFIAALFDIKEAFDKTYKTDDLQYKKCPNECCFSSSVFKILKKCGLIEKNKDWSKNGR